MKQKLKLFACLVGGQPFNLKLECHDMYFFIAEKIEDCYEHIIKDWNNRFPRFIDEKTQKIHNRVHLDAYQELNVIDDFDIVITQEQINQENHLFMYHLGGYQTNQLNEFHEQGFLIASSLSEARHKAKEVLKQKTEIYQDNFHKNAGPHIDNCINIEDVFLVEPIIATNGNNKINYQNLKINLQRQTDDKENKEKIHTTEYQENQKNQENPVHITGYMLLN